MKTNAFQVTEESVGKRLDHFLANCLQGDYSRSQLQSCIKKGFVTINQETVFSSHYKIKAGDEIVVKHEVAEAPRIEGEALTLDIVYEDDVLLVVNKPAGMVVHPGAGKQKHTLANALVHHCQQIKEVGEALRPGIVHRIDQDTSGLLVVAKTAKAHQHLAAQFKKHSIHRVYQAVVKGVVQHDEGRCDATIGTGKIFKKKMVVATGDGKHAVTHYKVLKRYQKASLVEVQLETGRTHQIRVHMSYLGHPILGDKTYGVKSRDIDRQALHAKALGFTHPETEEFVKFDSELPEDIQSLITHL